MCERTGEIKCRCDKYMISFVPPFKKQLKREVTEEDIAEARKHEANDREIHDTVLIAATFSMYNRYVDGLASFTPTDEKEYEAMGKRMVENGYTLPRQPK